MATVLLAVPVIVQRASAAAAPWLWAVAGGLVILAVVSAVVGPRVADATRVRLARGQVVLGAVGLLALLGLAIPAEPEHGLALAAAVAVTVAPVERRWLRLPLQGLVVVGTGLLLLRAGHAVLDVALWVALLGFVVWLAGAFSRDLLAVRRAARDARRSAERRAELLAAVGDLTGRSSGEAAGTVAATLRSLGFDVSGVSVIQGERLVPLALDGLPPASGLRVGEGVSGAAVAEDRTIVVSDYQGDPRRLEERERVHAAVAAPVRTRDGVVGVVIGGRHAAGRPPSAMVEIAEVLAAHLGGVLETEQRLQRQRELLERMRTLDAMRSRLVSEISDHVRDPLTVVRGIAQTLVSHGHDVSAEQRAQLLEGFDDQTRGLRETIDALLDFSKFQADHREPTLGLARLRDVLPTDAGLSRIGDDQTVVRTDPALLGRAVDLLVAVGGVTSVELEPLGERVHVRFVGAGDRSTSRARLLLRLAERLVVTVDGGWRIDARGVELRLPLAGPRADRASAQSGRAVGR